MSDDDKSAKVLPLNDDQTTMEFIVRVLESIFGKPRDEALKLALAIHRDCSGECGESASVGDPFIEANAADLVRVAWFLLGVDVIDALIKPVVYLLAPAAVRRRAG